MATRVKPKEDAIRPQKTRADRKIDRLLLNEDQVRSRAYEIYLARGNMPGDALEDWLRAERELREESDRFSGASTPS